MSGPKIRALVLCAGLGTRLRPLTWKQPKPLLPAAGTPIVGHTLAALRHAGCDTAVLNLHHLPESIPASLGDDWRGMPLVYSREPEILGTLGALAPPKDVLQEADAVVVINGDSLCPWPIESVVRRHLSSAADVTLLLLDRAPDPSLGGGIAIDDAGRIVQMRDHPAVAAIGKVRRRVFAGLHVLRPGLLDSLRAEPADVIEGLYQPLLAAGGALRGVVTRRRWHDLGTPGRYLRAVLDVARRPRPPQPPWRAARRNVVATDARIADDSDVRGSVLEKGVVVDAGARVYDSVLLPGAVVGAGSRVEHSVVGPGVQFPARSVVDQRMLTLRDPRHRLRDGESALGEIVYTPL